MHFYQIIIIPNSALKAPLFKMKIFSKFSSVWYDNEKMVNKNRFTGQCTFDLVLLKMTHTSGLGKLFFEITQVILHESILYVSHGS